MKDYFFFLNNHFTFERKYKPHSSILYKIAARNSIIVSLGGKHEKILYETILLFIRLLFLCLVQYQTTFDN